MKTSLKKINAHINILECNYFNFFCFCTLDQYTTPYLLGQFGGQIHVFLLQGLRFSSGGHQLLLFGQKVHDLTHINIQYLYIWIVYLKDNYYI